MKILNKIIFVFVCLFLFIPTSKALEQVNLYFFYGDGCPHCAAEEVVLERLEAKYDNLKVYRYETWYSLKNAQLLADVGELLDVTVSGIPFTVIGDEVIKGYSDGLGMDTQIEDLIIKYSNKEHNDCTGALLGKTDEKDNKYGTCTFGDNKEKEEEEVEKSSNIKVPIFGTIDAKTFSIPLISIVIGLIDGFNPCSMWVLLFLISILLGMKDKKRMWILGLTFILTSAIIYFAFMAAWLNVTIFVGSLQWFRLLISAVAIIGGIINIRTAIKNKDGGCDIVEEKKRTKIFDKVRKFTKQKSFILAVIGIIILAITVNIVELFCSAGLPVVYSQILAINELSKPAYLGYILLYVFFFMLDDIIIYTIAMKTMKLKGISTKYGVLSHTIGGIIMIIIGLLLILKPGWLMFG
ncbi:MAG: hypothetical protein PHQ89_00125 [Bacilli bacterium]|nr:hypothetical protein [Bacilli bacterium]